MWPTKQKKKKKKKKTIAAIAQAFEDEGGKFDYVFNLAAETKYSQTEEV